MKRIGIIALTILLAVALFGCSKQERMYTVISDGIEFQVDTELKTISDHKNTYTYDFNGDSSSFDATITYPDGSAYRYSTSGGVGQASLSGNYDKDAYVSGDKLVAVLHTVVPRQEDHGKIIILVFCFALGALNVIFPQVPWYLRYGWQYENAEPSDVALILTRVGGVAVILLGIILLLS